MGDTAPQVTLDRLSPANRERRAQGMPYAYADGFGVWHAVIPPDRENPERVARRLIADEMDMRGERGKGYRVRIKPEAGRGKSSDSLRFVEA